jgi:hypothetical protein
VGLFKKKEDKNNLEDNKTKSKKVKNKKEDKKDENLNSNTTTNENEKTIFEKNRKTLKDLIAPESLDFSESPKYATIGDNEYIKNFYVGVLPNQANFASFLHRLYNFGSIDTSIHINPVDNERAKADLSKLRTNLEMEYISSGNSTNRADDMASKVMEAQRLRTEIRDGYNKIFEASITATLYEEDLRDLNNSSDQLKEALGQNDIGIKSAIYCQEEAYKTNKPFNENYIGEYHTFDKRSLGCVFPFTSNNINHPNGILLGFNMDNGLPIMYDTFSERLDNYNMVIFAKSGGGKSTFIKMLASRSATLDRIINIFIDIEPEYIDICNTLGGQCVTIAPSSTSIINPFDVVIDLVENKVTGKEEEIILLSDKINNVASMIMTMAKGQIENNPYYNDIVRILIKDCVKSLYAEREITEDPRSLYTYEEDKLIHGKIVTGRKKKTMPTLSDWYKEIEKQSKENDNTTYQPFYDYILKVMSDFCRCTKGSLVSFDGQTNVELSYEVPFINFDVSGLNEKTELPIAQHLICDFIWEQMVKRNNKGYRIRVGVDEAWRMVKYPDALDFLITMFRRARKKNTSTVVISQQFDEFYREETAPIIKNADTKFFLPPDKTSIDNIRNVFKLTEGQTDFLSTCVRGEGLLIVNNVSAKVYIDIPDFEMEFVQTNQNKKRK